jgi:hypothetical protein
MKTREKIIGKKDWDKFAINESRRANLFFSSSHGKAILDILNKNGKVFSSELVSEYFGELEQNDIKWARKMDVIANNLGLNNTAFETYKHMEEAMLDVIKMLYIQFQNITKKRKNEMTNRFNNLERDQENKTMKRYIINEEQLEQLLNHLQNLAL